MLEFLFGRRETQLQLDEFVVVVGGGGGGRFRRRRRHFGRRIEELGVSAPDVAAQKFAADERFRTERTLRRGASVLDFVAVPKKKRENLL